MNSVTTTKRVDLAQLSAELGNVALTATTTIAGSTIETDAVTQTALQAAVDAHVAPDLAALSANEATIRDRADAALATNAAFLDLASPTNAQTLAQVKALARQNNGLIRLVLRRFDSTD